MITSKYTIRERNEATLLKKIIEQNEISRANLAEVTQLNKASVSAIVKKLLDDGLVMETREGDASNVGGRKPILLKFNPESSLVIGLDIGTNYIEGVLSYLDGTFVETISKRKLLIQADTIIETIKQAISDLEADVIEAHHGIVGMTVAIHGIVFKNDILYTPNYPMDEVSLLSELQAHYSFPIFLENEANLAALGEYAFSSKLKSLTSISIHSGIGAGIVENGILRNGKHGKAGEIGHSILFPNGKKCPCGNHGCLEQYASHAALYQTIKETLSLDYVNSDIIQEIWTEQPERIEAILRENALYLSIGINNIATIYDPEIVFINSSVYQKIPVMVDWLKDNMQSQFAKDIIICNSPLQSNATLLGAVIKSAQNFLNIDNLKFIQ